jgi:hypothetical protein
MYHKTPKRKINEMIKVAPSIKSSYPEAKFGIMVVNGLCSTTEQSIVNTLKKTVINQIRSKYLDYQRNSILPTYPLCHYAAYFRKYNKTYPVLGQLESVLLKGKNIPPVGTAIEMMFLAELNNLLLTAGHDLDLLEGTLTIDVAREP